MSRRLLWLSLALHRPFVTSGGSVDARELLLLRLEEEDGITAFGEVAPFEPYDGVSVTEIAERVHERPPPYPYVAAADEMAFLDLEGRRLGAPLAEPARATVAVNATIAGTTPDEVAESAEAARAAGYECVKLKVGLADDEARVGAARDALGRGALLRLDANCAWTVDQALTAIDRLGPHGIEFLEQPCATLGELAQVRSRAGRVRIAADESVQSADDVRAAADAGACDVVAVKLAPMGGFSAARDAIEACRAAGIAPYVSSTLDGPWGIAAALQLASAESIDLHCGLATLELFDAALAAALPAPEGGRLAVPSGPGLGIEVSDEAIAEVLLREL